MANTEKLTVTPSKIFLHVVESISKVFATDATYGDELEAGVIVALNKDGKLAIWNPNLDTTAEGADANLVNPYGILMEGADASAADVSLNVLLAGVVDQSKLISLVAGTTVAQGYDGLRMRNIICKEVI